MSYLWPYLPLLCCSAGLLFSSFRKWNPSSADSFSAVCQTSIVSLPDPYVMELSIPPPHFASCSSSTSTNAATSAPGIRGRVFHWMQGSYFPFVGTGCAWLQPFCLSSFSIKPNPNADLAEISDYHTLTLSESSWSGVKQSLGAKEGFPPLLVFFLVSTTQKSPVKKL